MPFNLGARFRRHPIGAAVAIVLCFWTVVIVVSLRFSRRADDFSDLVPPARQAADGSNAIPFLLSASGALHSHGEINRLWYSLTNKAADEAAIESLLTAEADSLRLFREAMRQPACVWTNPASTFEEIYSPATNWNAIYRLALIDAEVFSMRRDPTSAVSLIIDGMHFGNRLADSGAAMPGSLAGALLKSSAILSLKRIAHDRRTSDELLRSAIVRLASLTVGADAVANTVKEEIIHFVAESEVLANGKAATPNGQFDAEATRRLMAPAARAALASIGRPYINSPAARYRPNTSRWRFVSAFVGGNAMGAVLSGGKEEDLARLVERRCSYDNMVKSTRLILALLLYERANGRLPETLDELVPEFIDEIPADGFDGQPLRYSKERRLVWSVGRDLKDDGGILRIPGTNKDGDQLYPLE